MIARSFRRASARGWEDEILDETHETGTVREAIFTLATRPGPGGLGSAGEDGGGAVRAGGRGTLPDAGVAGEFGGDRAAVQRCVRARIDGRAEQSWSRTVHEWWSRCVSQKWVARHELDAAIRALGELLVDPREVARG